MEKQPVMFVGAGPGDPDLITVKGQRALAAADLVVYAGSLVPEALLVWAKGARAVNSASLHLSEIVDVMSEYVEKGLRVVRLHTGDPSLYGAIYEQMAELDKREIEYRVIPGVTAAFAAAAALGIEYTLPEVSQTLILTRMAGRTPVPEAESLKSLAAHQASMAIYLSITLLEELEDIIAEAYGEDFICAVVYKASHPEERVLYVPVRELASRVREAGIRSQALVVVSKTLNLEDGQLKYKSKLYDKDFKHEYRS